MTVGRPTFGILVAVAAVFAVLVTAGIVVWAARVVRRALVRRRGPGVWRRRDKVLGKGGLFRDEGKS